MLRAICLALATAALASAQNLPKAEPSLERLFQYPLIQGRSPDAPAMSPDGSKIAFGWNQTGVRRLDLWVMDYPSGQKRMIVEAAKIADFPRQDDERTDIEKKEQDLYDGGITGPKWSPDGKEILFSYQRRSWTVSPDGRTLQPLADQPTGYRNLQYSPDGKYISYEAGQNVYRIDRATGRSKQLTFFSKANTTVSGHEWSPDSKQILVLWSDDSKEGKGVMMDFSKDRAEVVNIQRMWNGDQSQNAKVGVVPADGGLVKFVSDLPPYHWSSGAEWAPDSKSIAYGWFSDDFKKYTVSVMVAETLKPIAAYTESAPETTINDWRPLTWTRNSKRILLGTDILDGRLGNRSVISFLPDGKDIQKVFAEKYDVGSMSRPERSDRLILVTAGRSPLKTEITLLEPNGQRQVVVVEPDGVSTAMAFNWAQPPSYSRDGKRIATLASDRTRNAELYAVEPKVNRLTTSQLPEFQKITWAKFEEVQFGTADGRILHGVLITKPDLDLTKPHPAFLSNVYADSAKLDWSGWIENYAAMNLDMVVLCVDFRSSWGYDGAFNSGYNGGKMGIVDVEEAVAAKNFLTTLPYVRADRVGIWGWSYGGYLTCMSLLTKPGTFYSGVAVASVTDWKSYNEWYTRRRLGLVKDDKDKVFEKTSPITYAAGLQDNLLLIHGMLDDNVLYQDTARLTQRLIENGRYFDLLAYPRDDHGIGKDTSRPHVMTSIVRYLYRTLTIP